MEPGLVAELDSLLAEGRVHMLERVNMKEPLNDGSRLLNESLSVLTFKDLLG